MPQIVLIDQNGQQIGQPVPVSAFVRPPIAGDVVTLRSAPNLDRRAVIATEHSWRRGPSGSDPTLYLHVRPYTPVATADGEHVIIPFLPEPEGDHVPIP
jgi:hypothetical protein